MHYIIPIHRQQITFFSLEEKVAADNPVRFIDAFVDTLDLSKLGFVCTTLKSEGRPPFHPKVFLKLYLYSYQNGLRSSRKMAKECARNVELQWLLGELCPNYHSIADFRKTNSVALRNTFKLFVDFLKHADLIGGELIAIDGTKVRASNSKKNNYSPKKIERHLEYIEAKTNEYLSLLDANDQAESSDKISTVEDKIARLKTQKIRYELLKDTLEQSGEPQINTTDEDARALLVQGQVVEVCYNMQAAVDEKHKLVVATHTINKNDRNALTDIATEAQTNLQTTAITVLADKGYNNARQIQNCQQVGITTLVAQQVLRLKRFFHSLTFCVLPQLAISEHFTVNPALKFHSSTQLQFCTSPPIEVTRCWQLVFSPPLLLDACLHFFSLSVSAVLAHFASALLPSIILISGISFMPSRFCRTGCCGLLRRLKTILQMFIFCSSLILSVNSGNSPR
jgi:transposase